MSISSTKKKKKKDIEIITTNAKGEDTTMHRLDIPDDEEDF